MRILPASYLFSFFLQNIENSVSNSSYSHQIKTKPGHVVSLLHVQALIRMRGGSGITEHYNNNTNN